jgi:hypothetical protein
MDKRKNKVKRIYERHGFKVCLSEKEGVYLPLFVRDLQGNKITPTDSNWSVIKAIHTEIIKL